MVGGRTVDVDLALSQDDARNLASGGRSTSTGKDNRNLYLVKPFSLSRLMLPMTLAGTVICALPCSRMLQPCQSVSHFTAWEAANAHLATDGSQQSMEPSRFRHSIGLGILQLAWKVC